MNDTPENTEERAGPPTHRPEESKATEGPSGLAAGPGQEFTLKRMPGQLQIEADKVDELAAQMAKCRAPENYALDAPFSVLHEKMRVLDVEMYMPRPARVRKNINFTDVASFTGYFNKFKEGYSPRIFAKRSSTGIQILGVLDFDEAGAHPDGGAMPRWGSHKIFLGLEYHPDYADLLQANGQWFSQTEFALFVEQNLHLFVAPDGATMLEIAQQLKGIRNADWKAGERLATGERSLEYVETVKAQGLRNEIIVPEYLEMKLPIFEGFEQKDIRAAFSWRIIEKDEKHQIGFSFRLLTKLQEREAEEEVKKQVAEQTAHDLLNVSEFEGIAYNTK